jgi:glycine/D-amino acid oxidase-like deaminating enzyme
LNAATLDDGQALARERSARKDAGLDAALLSRVAAARELSTDSQGALRFHDAFVIDPVRAALALAGAAETAGARIFERSTVTRTRFTRKQARVVLATGSIRTQGIVVATGEPGALFGQLRRHVRRQIGYVVVTHPLTAAMRRETGRHDAVVSEISPEPHWLRWLPEDRALFAGARSQPVAARQEQRALVQRTAQLMYELSVRYPAISGLPAAWSWDMPVVTTVDGLPWIGPHRNYPFHFFAMALGWHGDGLAWAAARAAVRHFKNEARKDDDVFGFVRHL